MLPILKKVHNDLKEIIDALAQASRKIDIIL